MELWGVRGVLVEFYEFTDFADFRYCRNVSEPIITKSASGSETLLEDGMP